MVRIIRAWKIDERIIGVLVVNEDFFKNALPGDFVEIEGERYPILSIKRTVGAVKLEVLANKTPSEKKLELIKSKPSKGRFAIIGPISDWIIAGLRLNNYELTGNYRDADFVIMTYPEYIPEPFPRIIFAPNLSSTWHDYIKFNEIFSKYNITARYDLKKPIAEESGSIIIDVPNLGMIIEYPARYLAYAIASGNRTIILGVLKNKPNYIALIGEIENNIVIYSSLAMMIPYDLIYGKGNNLRVLINLISGQLKMPESVEEPHEVSGVEEPDVVLLELEDIDKYSFFRKLLQRVSILGGLILNRNDTELEAIVIFPILDTKSSIKCKIKISGNTINIRALDIKEESSQIIERIRGIIMDLIREQKEKKHLIEKFKKIYIIATEVQRKLITAKDMIEIDMDVPMILEELKSAVSDLSADEVFSDIALEIMNTCEALERIRSREEKLLGDIKNELLAKIDDWINRVRRKGLDAFS